MCVYMDFWVWSKSWRSLVNISPLIHLCQQQYFNQYFSAAQLSEFLTCRQKQQMTLPVVSIVSPGKKLLHSVRTNLKQKKKNGRQHNGFQRDSGE